MGVAESAEIHGADLGTLLAIALFMQHGTWIAPEMQELDLSSEIGSYFEEEDPPRFVDERPKAPPRLSLLEQRRLPRRRAAPRVAR